MGECPRPTSMPPKAHSDATADARRTLRIEMTESRESALVEFVAARDAVVAGDVSEAAIQKLALVASRVASLVVLASEVQS